MTLRDAVIARGMWLQDGSSFEDDARACVPCFNDHDYEWSWDVPPLEELQRMIDWAIKKGVRL